MGRTPHGPSWPRSSPGTDARGAPAPIVIEVAVQELVGSALLLVDHLASMGSDALVDDLAIAGIGDEQSGGAGTLHQGLECRDCRDAARALAAVRGHEIEQEKRGGLGVDRCLFSLSAAVAPELKANQ
jgi:hypothetical protein